MKKMKSNRGVVHRYSRCFDCGWENNDYVTGRTRAIRHAREKQHYVVCDEGWCYWFDARLDATGKPPLILDPNWKGRTWHHCEKNLNAVAPGKK